MTKAVRKLDNLERAWRVIQQNGCTSKSDQVKLDLDKFAEDAPHNLRSLMGRLVSGSFKFGKAKGVPIPKLDGSGKPTGKFRPIVLAPVETRIVQRAILNVLVEVEPLKPFIKTPYSFGGIRSLRKRDEQRRQDELSAVPAAIQAVLTEIGSGAGFVASADIRAFFTRISKNHVIDVIGAVIPDHQFIAFLRKAITVELDNLALLREKAADFPIEEIGVAQGSSLSPLLGNIALANFDKIMNEGDCHCIRYIDDFIITAPTMKAANARLRTAKTILRDLGMEVAAEKSAKGGTAIANGFDFLGINISPGLIKPNAKAQARFLDSVTQAFLQTQTAMIGLKNGKPLDRRQSLVATLKRVDGMIDGWGKHYWFCNDGRVMENLDAQVSKRLGSFLGVYRTLRDDIQHNKHAQLLGISELGKNKREPFLYPSAKILPHDKINAAKYPTPPHPQTPPVPE